MNLKQKIVKLLQKRTKFEKKKLLLRIKFLASDICGKAHLGNENKEYVRKICNKAFPRKNSSDRHVFIHSELKNFVSEICGLAFKSNNNLRHHCTVHHVQCKCKYCY